MNTYHLIDRNNGCRLVPADNGPGYTTIQAETLEAAEALAEERGFACDWETGSYHVINLNEELAKAGLQLKGAEAAGRSA